MPFALLENPPGLWALLALVPLILLYLIRPKPKFMAIPSLMFFTKSLGSAKLTSFLKQFVRDVLFLLQLFAILALAFVLAKPYSVYLHDVTAKNTIIVLDVSASSQVIEGSTTRFEEGRQKALQLLGSKNAVILAKDVPLIGVKDASLQEAREYLLSLEPKDTTTRLGEAIILAGETLGGNEGRVIVLSDFINTGGQDVEIAKAVLESKGIVIDFVSTSTGKRRNVGFIDVIADESHTTVYVKNFEDASRTVPVFVGETRKDLTIGVGAVETYSFQTPPGVTRAHLEYADDFPVDNQVFISAPSRQKIRVLLITNNESIFLKNALISSGLVDLTIAQPPIVPKDQFDVYIIHNVRPDQILPGTFEDIAEKVKTGSTVIIHAQDDSEEIDYKGLIPLRFMGRLDSGVIQVDQLNRFTKNTEFGQVSYFLLAQKTDNFLSVAFADNSTIIGVGKIGVGKVFYYGILDRASDFKFNPSYPIFWTEVVKYVTNQQDMKTLNYKTGETLIFDTPQKIETPTKIIKQAAIIFEHAGVYTVDTKKIAVNLLNEQESDINLKDSFGAKGVAVELRAVREERKYYWEYVLLSATLVALVLELVVMKRRGDV